MTSHLRWRMSSQHWHWNPGAHLRAPASPGVPTIEFPAKYEKALRQIAQLQGKVSDCNAEIKTYEKEIDCTQRANRRIDAGA